MAWCLGIYATFKKVVVARVIVRLGRSGGSKRWSYRREMMGRDHRAGTHIEMWYGLSSLRYGYEVAHKVDDIVGGGKEKSLSLSGVFVVPYWSITLTVRTFVVGSK